MRALLFATLAAVFAAIAYAGVVDTTDATFEEVIKSNDFVIMEFYAPWCGHCKKLEPEYVEAAEQIGDLAVLAKIDATAEPENAKTYGIKGYPSIKVFRDGAYTEDYNGGRTAADIVKYVKGNSGPAVKAAASAEELETLKQENPVLVTLFDETVGTPKFEALEAAAKELRSQYAFAVVTDAAVASAAGASLGQLVLFKQFDDKEVKFEGDATSADEIKAFVGGNGVPLFDEIGPTNYKMYVDRKLPIVWVFRQPDDEVTLAAGQAAAPQFKGELSFVWINAVQYGGMAQRLGLPADKFPAVAIDNQGKHFAMPDGEINADSLTAFAKSFTSGELQATIKSEEVPAEHTVEGLTTLTGKTFTELVVDADVDTFIEFYAPWCGHCKQLAPTYEKVAKTLEGDAVRVAKIDATANDFPTETFDVKGFPTMYFYNRATKQAERYEGGRSEDDMVNFIKGKIGASSGSNEEL